MQTLPCARPPPGGPAPTAGAAAAPQPAPASAADHGRCAPAGAGGCAPAAPEEVRRRRARGWRGNRCRAQPRWRLRGGRRRRCPVPRPPASPQAAAAPRAVRESGLLSVPAAAVRGRGRHSASAGQEGWREGDRGGSRSGAAGPVLAADRPPPSPCVTTFRGQPRRGASRLPPPKRSRAPGGASGGGGGGPREPGGGRPPWAGLGWAGGGWSEARVGSVAAGGRMDLGRKSVEMSPLRSLDGALGSTRCWFRFLFGLRKPLGSEFERKVPENCHLCANGNGAVLCHGYYFIARGALSLRLEVTICQVWYFLRIILWFGRRDLSVCEKQCLT